MPDVTTHILDLARGCPAQHVKIEMYFLESKTEKRQIVTRATNDDGRVNEPLIQDQDFLEGEYEIHYFVGDYLREQGLVNADPHFLDCVVTRVYLSSNQAHYHIPLLVSPWGYQVYRGS
ncbi:hydroxyisourate hydrolase [Alkalicoccobacillus murimartini]|uniref:5-hydroxyisourate hydrolase n=1 Tax=Alkalicoccobacillus murimartini TaxID=171685 RepID=A0ABT9YFV0_9BACI|nr:hydroxyisourate hydrolase [Alkalicoccobacillus murimartini]MDQ0206738.1 5-hydroxyisourate hydrolase [Alkalicoccobacillus murimartini]